MNKNKNSKTPCVINGHNSIYKIRTVQYLQESSYRFNLDSFSMTNKNMNSSADHLPSVVRFKTVISEFQLILC